MAINRKMDTYFLCPNAHKLNGPAIPLRPRYTRVFQFDDLATVV